MGKMQASVDYGFAEALASIAFAGRHALRLTDKIHSAGRSITAPVLVDTVNEWEYVPLAAIASRRRARRSARSQFLTSERAAWASNTGFSRDFPEALVLWEAQSRFCEWRAGDHRSIYQRG